MDGAPVLKVAPSNGGNAEFFDEELLRRVKQALDTAVEVVIPATDMRPFPGQPRKYFNDESIRTLSESINLGGQTTSGLVRKVQGDGRYEVLDLKGRLELRKLPGKTNYELVDGERRWRSILLIPASKRPLYKAKAIDADDEVVRYLIAGISNFNREGHTALEMVDSIDLLIGLKIPMKKIAVLHGISEFWAYQMHGLKNLVPEVRRLLDPELPRAQQLPIAAAIQISKIGGKFQLGLAERVVKKEVTLGRLRGEVVKTAQREGSPIRLREVSPHHQWASVRNKMDLALRSAGDVEDILKRGMVNPFIETRPGECSTLLQKIRETQETLARVSAQLFAKQKKS